MSLHELYRHQLDAMANGVPFVTSTGLRVNLLPRWAPEWRKLEFRLAKANAKFADQHWYEMPEDVLDEREIEQFVVGVVDWDAAMAGMPCTLENRRTAAREIVPLRNEVVAEITRRRNEAQEQAVALGKDLPPSSGSA